MRKKITLHMFLLKRSHTLYVVYVVMESFSKVCIGEKDYTTHFSFEAVHTIYPGQRGEVREQVCRLPME